MKKVKAMLGTGNSWASRHTHDGLGKPLPKWIRDGSVAYEPIKSKHISSGKPLGPRTQS
jgi:hypothetical protein